MADTKKEHYVPRCYLENFEGEDSSMVTCKLTAGASRPPYSVGIDFAGSFAGESPLQCRRWCVCEFTGR